MIERVPEVVRCDHHLARPLAGAVAVPPPVPPVQHAVPQDREPRLPQQRRAVGAAEPRRPRVARHGAQVDVGTQPNAAGHERPQYRLPVVRTRERHVQELVEPAGTQHGRVDELRSVRRGDDEDAPAAVEAVHLGEELVDDPLAHAAAPRGSVGAPAGAERVELVEEDYARARGTCALEDDADRALGLADVLVEELGALDGYEVGARLVGYRLGEERLCRLEENFGRWSSAVRVREEKKVIGIAYKSGRAKFVLTLPQPGGP